ncbi:MAG: ABC transporter permease [Candidatus Aminicenantes bacterium]|nr:MAG: ABC transporter permease [Candidatus Aminicenantes bacterium]
MTAWNIAFKDLKLAFKDKMFFFWLLVFPLLFAVVFSLAFPESSESIQKISLNVIDNDKGLLSQALITELEGEKYTVESLEKETDRKIRTLIIPENFSKNILEGKQVELILEKEAESNIEASQAAYSNVLKAVIKILTKLVTLASQNESELQEKFDQHDIEKLIILKSELAGKLGAIPGGFNHMIPASSVMFILFTVLMYGGITLLEERRLGQLERIYLSPASFSSIIAGKWTSAFLLGMAQITLLFLIGKIIFRTHLGNSILALFLVAFFFCGTIAGMSILFGSIIKKEEVLIVFNIIFANLMSALGGCWIPLELFPASMKKVTYIFPTGWAMDAFHQLIFFGHGLKSVLFNILILSIFALVFLVLAVRFFKLRKI